MFKKILSVVTLLLVALIAYKAFSGTVEIDGQTMTMLDGTWYSLQHINIWIVLLIIPEQILMYYFGSFYLSGLISNIILPPLLSITMFSVLAVGLFANTSFIEPIKTWADALLDFHLRVVDFFSSQKWLCIEMTPGDMRYLCGFIIILLLILFLKMRTHKNLSTTDMVC